MGSNGCNNNYTMQGNKHKINCRISAKHVFILQFITRWVLIDFERMLQVSALWIEIEIFWFRYNGEIFLIKISIQLIIFSWLNAWYLAYYHLCSFINTPFVIFLWGFLWTIITLQQCASYINVYTSLWS